MKKTTKYGVKLLLSLALLSPLMARVDTADFTIAPGVAAFSEAHGVWVLGAGATGAGDQALSTVGPANGTTTQAITDIGDGAEHTDTKIDHLVLCQESTDPATTATTRVIAVDNAVPATLNVVNMDGTGYVAGAAGSGGLLEDGNSDDSAGIVALACTSGLATPNYIFAAVKANGGTFGAGNSGIAVVGIDDANAMTTHDADAGSAGDNAYLVNHTSAELDLGSTNAPVGLSNFARLHWNKNLNRLYLGVEFAGHATLTSDFATVACYSYTAGTGITNVQLCTDLDGYGDGSYTTAVDTTASNIVGTAGIAATTIMTAERIDSMYTSTGHDYLIVLGGQVAATRAANKVFAIPLVGPQGDFPGALAHITWPSTGHDAQSVPVVAWDSRATAQTNLISEAHVAAKVGGGALPVVATASEITGMQVTGDTVYVGCNATQATTDEPGIYYSQAIFNDLGTIVKWTDWQKWVPNSVSGADVADGRVNLFAVDTARGKTWTISTADTNQAHVNIWGKDGALTTYRGQINSKLTGGCYSYFNLGSYVENWGDENRARYAFFGGDNQVVAARYAYTGGAVTADTFHYIENPTGNAAVGGGIWTNAANAAVNMNVGLENAGPITAIGWMGEAPTTTDNYIFCGGNRGLYILASTAATPIGFDTDLGTGVSGNSIAMNDALSIFTSEYKWHAHTGITDPVVKIVNVPHATAASAFVLTQGTSHKIWRIAGAAANVATVITNTAAIGTAGLSGDDFASVRHIHDIELVPQDGNDEVAFELIASTDLGHYITTDAPVNGSTTAATANWKKITDAQYRAYHLSKPQACRGSQYLWGTNRIDDATTGTKERRTRLNSIQLNDLSTTREFNDYHTDSDLYHHHVLNTPTTPLWSNGSVRFLGTRVKPHSNTKHSTLSTLPYHVGITDTYQTGITAIPDSVIANDIKHVYWVADVGAGDIMAGTDIGVISLE